MIYFHFNKLSICITSIHISLVFWEAFIDGANMGDRASVVPSCLPQIYFYIHCLASQQDTTWP